MLPPLPATAGNHTRAPRVKENALAHRSMRESGQTT
jgi:hypothetical protein